jgi:hypothetical protein
MPPPDESEWQHVPRNSILPNHSFAFSSERLKALSPYHLMRPRREALGGFAARTTGYERCPALPPLTRLALEPRAVPIPAIGFAELGFEDAGFAAGT